MRKFEETLIVLTTIIGISAVAPVQAANSYQEVVESHSAPLRASEKAELRTNNNSASVTNSFQDVVEKNSAPIRSQETHEVRTEMADSSAPTSYQDVVNGHKS